MNRKARATIEEFSMLRQGDTVTAAVSGGADSVALLDFLCSLTDLRLTVRACHLNHCLRGEESDRDEQLVRTMCEQYGIPLDLRRVEVKALARERGVSIEVAAREARYAFFDELAEKYRCKIATAHTLSDAAETVLLNLARGTGIAGLCGIPPVRGAVVRPLIGCTRRETEDYCAAHGLCYVTDSTNLTDRYTRNHIRHNVLGRRPNGIGHHKAAADGVDAHPLAGYKFNSRVALVVFCTGAVRAGENQGHAAVLVIHLTHHGQGGRRRLRLPVFLLHDVRVLYSHVARLPSWVMVPS